MKRFLTILCMGAVLPMCVQVSRGAAAVKGLPQWFDRVRISAWPGILPWFVEFGPASEQALRSRANEALQQVADPKPGERGKAVRLLGEIGGAIPLPEAMPDLTEIAKSDPHVESVPADKLRTRMRDEYTIRTSATKALENIQQRLALEKWLSAYPQGERAKRIVAVLSNRGPGWLYSRKPAEDDVLMMWLVRHRIESLPILMKVESGEPFLGSNGRIPTIETPNRAARTAAAIVIGVNKVRNGVPCLLRLLEDPTCHAQFANQPQPFEEAKVAPERLVRSYPVRDTAAGALQLMGYKVTFDGARYRVARAS